MRAPQKPPVWDTPEPTRRPAPGPLSRESIVAAAIALADDEGLAAVSLRKVAAKLNAGPMRLYAYTSTKEGLLELMVDAVYGEIDATHAKGADWRAIIRSIAQRTREAALRHPWFADLLGGRIHLGPNALAYLEASLAAFHGAPGFDDIDTVLQAGKTIIAYVIGAIRGEIGEMRAERDSGLSEEEWQGASWPHVQRMIATGQFPNFARVVHDAVHPKPDVVFEQGLACVIDGIAARLGR